MKYLCFLLLLAGIASCTDKVIEKPEDLLSEDEMVAIYFDISLFNAAQNSGYDKFREHGINTREYLYKKHNIDSLQLAKSSNYYAAKPVIYERIYQRVEDRLDSLKIDFDALIGTEAGNRAKAGISKDSTVKTPDIPEEIQEEIADSL